MFLARNRREAGASTAEYAGLIVLAALIVAALFTVIPTPLGDGVSDALCRIFHPGDAATCGEHAKSPDEKYKPTACTTQTSSSQQGLTFDVSIVRFGGGLTFLKTKTSDGKITLTAVQNGKAGLQYGGSLGARAGKYNAGVDLGADATFNVGVGDGWTFKDDANANEFIKKIKARESLNSFESSPAGWLPGKAIEKAYGGLRLPPPNITRYEAASDANGNGSLGLSLGLKQKTPKTGRDQRSDWRLSPNARGYAGININGKIIYEKDTQKKQTSWTYQLAGGGNYGEDHVVGNGHQGQVQTRGAMTAHFDNRTGKLVGLDFVQTHIANGDATTTTTTLPVTDENRARVEHSLVVPGSDPVSNTLALNWNDMVPGHDPGPNASDLEKELFKNGQVQKVNYTYTGDSNSYGLSGKAGPIALGAALDLADSGQTVKDAQYLGAPGADGRRSFVPFKECHN